MSERQLSSEQKQQIDQLVFAGRKIPAIKLVVDATGADLATAKRAVEAREAELRRSHPDRFVHRGCMGSIVLLLGLAAVAGVTAAHTIYL